MWYYELDEEGIFHKKEVDSYKYTNILVKPLLIGVCGTDKEIYKRHREGIKYPLVIGHEVVGQVMDIKSSQRNDLHQGDFVVIFPNYWCGTCFDCRVGHFNTCQRKISIGVTAPGALSEYIDVESKYLFKVPKELTIYEAVFTEPLSVVVRAIKKLDLNSSENNNILIIGGGALGYFSTILLKFLYNDRIHSIIIKEYDPVKVNTLKEIFNKEDNIYIINNINEYPYDLEYLTNLKVIDTVGNSSSINDVLRISDIAPSGIKVIIVGLGERNVTIDLNKIVRREIKIEGSIIYTPQDFLDTINVLRKIHSENYEYFYMMPIAEIPLKSINDYFKQEIDDATVIKVIINPYAESFRKMRLKDFISSAHNDI